MALGAPTMLALLALIPAAGVGWWWLWRARRLHRLAVGAEVAGQRRGVTASRTLMLIVLGLVAVAAARPMWNTGEETLGLSDSSLVIALDVSQSMAAEDVATSASQGVQTEASVSRFAAAKAEIQRLVDGRRGDRVGLVIFAGDAFLRFPLTRDHEAALQVLEALQPGEALVVPGSNIANAIDLAAETIVRATEEDGSDVVSGAIAVVSDGEAHVGEAVAAASAARALGMQVFTVGVGSERGATIPRGLQGGPLGGSTDPKLDLTTGAPIISRLDVTHLQAIADAGGGRYIELDQPGTMTSMNADLAALDLVREVVVEETALAEQFQWFAVAATLVLLCSVAARVFGRKPSRWLGIASLGALVASILVVNGCGGVGIGQLNREGIEHYESGEYAEALDAWREAQELGRRTDAGIDAQLHLNVGRALHRLGEFQRAETESLAALRSDDPDVRAVAWFHTGNHRWANQDLLGARLAFVEALRESPSLIDAKINLEIINALLESLQEDDQAADQGDEPGQAGDGQPGDANAAGDRAQSDANEDAQATPGGGQAIAGEGERPGQSAPTEGPLANPVAPTFADEESLLERREAAMEELQAALDELPLENASLEQALAVLDALRAVPGERLAAGQLQTNDQPYDW